MVQTRKMRRALEAEDQKNARRTTTKAVPPTGLLDLPPELRNNIYRYVMVSDRPIEVKCLYINSSSNSNGRYRFIMVPALSRVCKQLRLETRRLFLAENEFKLSREFIRRRRAPSLVALQEMHQSVGLEIQTLHISHQFRKELPPHLYSVCTADLTLSKVGDRVEVIKQEYSGRSHAEIYGPRRHDIEVCGCRVQTFAREFNGKPGPHDVVSFLRGVLDGLGGPSPFDIGRYGTTYVGYRCLTCRGGRYGCMPY